MTLCKVCTSSNREQYEELKEEGTSLRELERYAKERNDEQISHRSFHSHFNDNHDEEFRKKIYINKLNKRCRFAMNLEKEISLSKKMKNIANEDEDRWEELNVLLSQSLDLLNELITRGGRS